MILMCVGMIFGNAVAFSDADPKHEIDDVILHMDTNDLDGLPNKCEICLTIMSAIKFYVNENSTPVSIIIQIWIIVNK